MHNLVVDEEDPLSGAALVCSTVVLCCCRRRCRRLLVTRHAKSIDKGRGLEHRLRLLSRGVGVEEQRRTRAHLWAYAVA